MPELSSADHADSPPSIAIPREYNAAHDLIQRNLRAGRADKSAFIDDLGNYTYAELDRRTSAFANVLRAQGLGMEDRILLCLHDTIDFPTAFLGAIKAGVVPVAVISAALLPLFQTLVGHLPALERILVSGGNPGEQDSLARLIAQAPSTFASAPTTCDDVCFWLYSSGSTGAPKGTVHVHSSLIQTAELYAKPILGIEETDVVFSAAKLFFAYGLGNALTFPMSVGATAVLMAERPT